MLKYTRIRQITTLNLDKLFINCYINMSDIKTKKEEKSMSKSATVYTLMAALLEAEKILGQGRKWQAKNPIQAQLIADFLKHISEAGQIKEIESIASRDAKTINDFLAQRGFSITLNPFMPREFGVAAVLDLLVKWFQPGDKIKITTWSNHTYPGVHLKKGVQFFNVNGDQTKTVSKIRTQTDDEVFMTMIDQVPDGLDLLEFAATLLAQIRYSGDEYEGLHFPMVDFKNQPDISWLLGMATTDNLGGPALISQAKQETKLRMNEIGARVQDAVAMATMKCMVMPKKPLIINKPFLCIFTRPGLNFPLAVFHLEPDCWKNPGSLD